MRRLPAVLVLAFVPFALVAMTLALFAARDGESTLEAAGVAAAIFCTVIAGGGLVAFGAKTAAPVLRLPGVRIVLAAFAVAGAVATAAEDGFEWGDAQVAFVGGVFGAAVPFLALSLAFVPVGLVRAARALRKGGAAGEAVTPAAERSGSPGGAP